MTIKEYSTERGVSTQAIYKRLKARGIRTEDITEKGSGQLTAEGEALMRALYPVNPVEQPKDNLRASQLRVEALTKEKTVLQLEVDKLREQVQALTEERDFLRGALTHSQDMEALRARLEVLEAGQRAAQAQALTDGSSGGEKKRRGLWARLRGKGRGEG